MGVECPKCKTENTSDSEFCKKCATPLPSSKEISVTETLEIPKEELATGSIFAGRYQIIEELGKGGMGKVYKAIDKKLNEEVALKIIKPEIASDKKTLERFNNELKFARKIAHKNVGRMYELMEEKGTHFITMEYVPGQDLRGLIRQTGQLTVGTALSIAKQVCEGLTEAHRLGVIHRDLKPQNIMIDKEGMARIMDFGIARSVSGKGITGAGVIIGTPEYMSPEQVESKETDQRSDIYSLGVILYEMVTGRVPFEGDTPLSVAVKHKTETPPNPKEINTQIPENLSNLILRCMEKDKEKRYKSAGEVRSELENIEKGIPTTEKVIPKRKPITSREITVQFSIKKIFTPALAILSLAIIVLIIWSPWAKRVPTSNTVKRFTVNLNQDESLGGTNYGNNLAISPDGKLLIYQATVGNVTQLYLRPIDQFDSSPLPGTENAEDPFFSPDGNWIGFFQDGMLKKLRIGSASPVTICKGTPQPKGATWGTDGSIIFGGTTPGLIRVTDSGGTPREITTPNSENNEIYHRYPQILPGEKTVLFQIGYTGNINYPRIAVLSLETFKWRIILEEASYWPSYAPSGHIVYTQSGILMAVPFDLQRLEISGNPIAVLENVLIPRDKPINISFSLDGTLAYVSGISEETENHLVWVNYEGQSALLNQELLSYGHPRISPDGKKIAMEQSGKLYIYELERNIVTQLTSKGSIIYPVWSSDSKLLAFTSDWKGKGGSKTIYLISIDGSKEADEAYNSEFPIYPASWSPDGMWIAFYEINPTTQRDIWVLSLKDRTAKPIIATQNNERVPMFSPDGRFIAYVSNETGRDEIFVQPYPTTGVKWQVSHDGGREPFWAPNGSKLYYRMESKMMSVDIESEPAFDWGNAQIVFEGDFFSHLNYTTYCITPDGDQFMMSKPRGDLVVRQINVVLNWFEELKRLAPLGK
jgi:serine/threonine protein kinase